MARPAEAESGDELPEYCTTGVLVLGCGNPLMGDDGFGPAVAERLLQQGAESRPGAGSRVQGAGDDDSPGTRHPAPGTRSSSQHPAPRTPSSSQHPAPGTPHLDSSICIINAGTGSRGIIFNLVSGPIRPRAIIIVDALQAGRMPGELFWVEIEDLSLEKAEDFSLHMTPASNMLLELKKMGVEIRVLACEPKNLPDVMTGGLSAEVAAAVGPAAEKVLRAADEILKSA